MPRKKLTPDVSAETPPAEAPKPSRSRRKAVADDETAATAPGNPISPFNLLTTDWTELGSGVSFGSDTGNTYSDLFGTGQTVTGIGFYIDNLAVGTNTSTVRFDNLVIDGVPEPSSVICGLTGGLLFGLRRRR